ncbi:MAG: hypothetical protein FWG61_08610 [Firmicutes bacterium]|nr:hypothetical protein [Bacillota bacterium]
MKKIRFLLEYNCLPIWIYGENGEPYGPDIPDELKNDKEFVSMINMIQEEYDGLFENNNMRFEFNGFASEYHKNRFLENVARAIDMAETKVGNLYQIQNDINPAIQLIR